MDNEWVNFNQFDLVLCNQVLEHVPNPERALFNLIKITKSGGAIWITCPAICGIHGEPYYFSSGYNPRFLKQLGEKIGLETKHLGSWGNKKILLNSVLNNWLTEPNLRPLAINRAQFRFPTLFFLDGRSNQLDIITDSWELFIKP